MGKTDKLTRQIQRISSQIILYELNDPRIKFTTVTKIKLTDDFRYCTISVSILGPPSEQRTTMRGLQGARGFIQKQLASRLSLRNAPIVTIEHDRSIEKSFEMFKRLDEDRKNDQESQNEEGKEESPQKDG